MNGKKNSQEEEDTRIMDAMFGRVLLHFKCFFSVNNAPVGAASLALGVYPRHTRGTPAAPSPADMLTSMNSWPNLPLCPV